MLSNELRKLRKITGLTQSEFAKKINVARTTYAMYEQGHREPDYETLIKIADCHDVSTDFLLGKPDNHYMKEDVKKSAIIDKITMDFPDAELMFNDLANMSADDMQEVYDFIKFKRSQKKEE